MCPLETLLDEHLLQVPADIPAQTLNGAQLAVGMYDTHSGERQHFDGGRQTVLLCTVSIALQ